VSTIRHLAPPANRGAQLRRVPRLTVRALRLVWDSSRRHLLTTVLLQLAAAGVVAAQLLFARELLRAAVATGGGGSVGHIYPWLIAIAACAGGLGAITAFTAHEQKLLVELVSRHAFDRIIASASAAELADFERPEFYDQLQRARNSGLYRLVEMVSSVTALATAAFMSIGISVALFVIHPLLLPLVAAAGVFPLVATILNSREAYVFEYALAPESRERQYLMELLTEREPAQEVRMFDSAGFLHARYGALTDERLGRMRAFLRGRLKVALVGNLGGTLGSAVALGALVVLIETHRLAVPAALTAAFAMQQLSGRLAAATASVGRLIESGMFVDDFDEFVRVADQEPARARTATTQAVGGLGRLEVDSLSFAYPGTNRRVLDNVSLEVGAGEVVALVGENGSGKTTLVKLISGLYAADSGRIRWNGVDASALDGEAVRADMTVLFQDYIQYHLTVRDNIVLGRPNAPTEEHAVRSAAERAGAAPFLEGLPGGYDTRLGREFYEGYELSVGQWQRLALARAFYRGGSFLVLDEPTASLDPRAEAELFGQIRELARGRSVLLVSHRLSSVRTADRIYLLHDGRVVESGDHESLVAVGGRYSELFALQSSASLADPARAS
jgi:ATP-binding cassette subfamily B protein